MTMRTIALTEQEEALITRLVLSGRYRDVGDVVSEGLTLIVTREDLEHATEPRPCNERCALNAAELADLRALIAEVDKAREKMAPTSMDEILAWRDEGRA